MKCARHALPQQALLWQPHAGDSETRTGAFEPNGIIRYKESDANGSAENARRESV